MEFKGFQEREDHVHNRKDGGLAFPKAGFLEDKFNGMSLRDYFAAAALQGWLGNPDCATPTKESQVMWNKAQAEAAYMLADAMLAEREKK